LLELFLLMQPALRPWMWVASLLFAGAAGILCIVAGSRRVRSQLCWYSVAGGSLSLFIGLLSRGLQDYEIGRMPQPLGRDDSGFQAAVVFFLIAALALVVGEGAWLRRAKLGLDVAILVIAPLVAAMPISDRWNFSPEQERIWSAALLFLTAYSAVCYGMVVATRRVAFVQRGAAESALTLAVLTLGAAVAFQTLRLALPSLVNVQLGQTLWLLVVSMLALTGWRAARRREPADSSVQEREIGEDSRLRLLPAALAGAVVTLIALQQIGTSEPPSSALFFGSSSLFWLIVSRLLVTLAENRWLVRGRQTADRSQLAMRDLSLALNSSLEPARVYQHVCRTGQAILRADFTVLWLVDRASRELVAVEAAGVRRAEVLRRRLSLEDRSSLAVRVVRGRAPELVQQAADAHRSQPFLTVLVGSQCLLAVPLRSGQRAMGALVFSHSRDSVGFRPEDVARAEVLANQAAVALRNAELYQDTRRGLDEMSTLYEYTRACDGASLSRDIARALLATLQSKIEFQQGTVFLADNGLLVSSRGIVMRRLNGPGEPNWDVAPANVSPVARQAFRACQSIQASRESPNFRPSRPQTISLLAVPMPLRDHAVGVVELESDRSNLADESVERLVSALARHAALAIDNLRLEEDTREVADLKKLDRLKTELLDTVSHELKTPLAAIKGYATTLVQHRRMKPELRQEFLGIIDSESDRLGGLIGNLLDMSRLEAGVLKVDPAPVQLGRVVENAVKQAQHLTDLHHVSLDWRSDPYVMADVSRIIQVLTNLLNNAIKYSPDGGDIRVAGRAHGKMLEISVADCGVGIAPRDLDKIFDRFHRVDGDLARRVSGTGLGLPICRGLVEAHGGRIWVESEPDTGSIFKFSLPVCDPGGS
jgi:signal transduction histidine kinase